MISFKKIPFDLLGFAIASVQTIVAIEFELRLYNAPSLAGKIGHNFLDINL